MGRLSSLDFDAELEYDETAAGILLPVRLIHGDRSVVGVGVLPFYGKSGARIVGRRGWLDRVRLGIAHGERRLFLGHNSR